MKTYQIVLFTTDGLKTELYCDTEIFLDFELRMIKKYSSFTMQSSKEIK